MVRSRLATAVHRRLRCDHGQSLVEFAAVCFLLCELVFGVMDFGRVFFTQMTLQHAVREAGRFAVTGNKLADPNNPGQQLTRVESIKAVARRAAAGLDVSSLTVTSAAGNNTAGGPGQNVTISLTTTIRFITPIIGQFFNGGRYTMTVRTTFKNEPFPPALTN
jgi:Flp pilus assembly protein TadG